jgi:hypothetical protein
MTCGGKVTSMLIPLVLLVMAPASLRTEDTAGTTVKGYVLDSACAFIKNLKKPINSDCAIACAKAGSPLAILANDGKIYLPISSAIPAAGQNEQLLKFAGQRVTATGKVYEKGGSHAIVIDKIEAAPASK